MPFDVGAQKWARDLGSDVGSLGYRWSGDRLRYAVVVLFLLSCAPVLSAPLELPGLLLNDTWLEHKLGHPDLILLDARPRKEYDELHIEGAVSLPYTDTIAAHGDYKLIISLSKAKELFSSIGIDRGKTVVIYDGGEATQASRLFWVLEAYGHPSVALLDGGYAQWNAADLPVSMVPASPTRSEFIPQPQAERIATKLTTRLALKNPNIALIDSRIAQEFLGIKSKTRIPGRIPEAINVPWAENLSKPSGVPHYKTQEDLRKLYAFVGDRKAITYCNSGNEATLTYFVLRLLGINSAVYDGSWAEWSTDSEMPKVLAQDGEP